MAKKTKTKTAAKSSPKAIAKGKGKTKAKATKSSAKKKPAAAKASKVANARNVRKAAPAKGKSAVKKAAKPVSKASGKKVKAKVIVKPKAKPVKAKIQKKPAVQTKVQPALKPVVKTAPAPVISKPNPVKPIEKVKAKETTTATPNGNGLKLRYSDKELGEFREIILDKLTDARRDLELLRSSMSHLDDHGTDDTSPTFKLMEDGSDVLTKEETAQLASRQQKFIKHLEDALVRIENKSYGICRATGTLIPKERLRVVPHATLSIEAKQKQF